MCVFKRQRSLLYLCDFNNNDLQFGADVTYEELLAKKDELLDMSNATEGWTWRKKRQAEMAKK